jgi:hypothetical protein
LPAALCCAARPASFVQPCAWEGWCVCTAELSPQMASVCSRLLRKHTRARTRAHTRAHRTSTLASHSCWTARANSGLAARRLPALLIELAGLPCCSLMRCSSCTSAGNINAMCAERSDRWHFVALPRQGTLKRTTLAFHTPYKRVANQALAVYAAAPRPHAFKRASTAEFDRSHITQAPAAGPGARQRI